MANKTTFQTKLIAEGIAVNNDFGYNVLLNQIFDIPVSQKFKIHTGLFAVTSNETSLDLKEDYQVYSNIESPNHIGFQETYFSFQHSHLQLKAGLQDVNTDFYFSQTATHFAHSSFGLDPISAVSAVAATYPYTGLSASLLYRFKNGVGLKIGAFEGNSIRNKNDVFVSPIPELKRGEGALLITELERSFFTNKLTLKAAYYYHTGRFTNYNLQPAQPAMTPKTRGLHAVYILGDFKLVEKGQKRLDAFFQFSEASQQTALFTSYQAVGIVGTNLISASFTNKIGFAFGNMSSQPLFTERTFNAGTQRQFEINASADVAHYLSIQGYAMYLRTVQPYTAYGIRTKLTFN